MKIIIIFATLIFFLTSCGSAAPDAGDWCYRFDFTMSQAGASITHGVWESGRGIRTDSEGRLDVIYTHSQMVMPANFNVSASRGEIVAPINLVVYAQVFGLVIDTVVTTIPITESEYTGGITGTGGGEQGTVLRIEAEASAPLYLRWIEVRGFNPNPFGSNSCHSSYGGDTGRPTPTAIPLPDFEMLEDLLEVDIDLAGIDGSLLAPNGSPLLPGETGAVVFSYAKWLMSANAANSIFGPFAPVISHLSIYIAARMALFAVYVVIYAAVYIIRWIVWIFKLVMQIIATIASVIDTIVGKALSFVFKFFGG